MSKSLSPPASTAQPTASPKSRIQELDALRGYALCGIIFINIPQTMDMANFAGQIPDGVRWFLMGRFYPVFALLFGVGFGIFLRSAAGHVDPPRILMVRRLFALAVFGFLHQTLQPGEVLLPYAIFGLIVLLPLSFLGPLESVLIGALVTVLGLVVGLGGYALLPGLFALGYALAELRVPETLARRTRQLLLTALCCAALALLVLGLLELRLDAVAEFWLGLALSSTMAMGYAALFLALLRTPFGRVMPLTLVPMGRMALTNYLTATLLFVPIGAAMELRGSDRWAEAALLGAAILVVQLIWSALWLRRFRYGPFEWIWRCATYWQLLPIRRPVT
ncbi:MAG: DUF418 domain-containing protein [Actinomadura sp.]